MSSIGEHSKNDVDMLGTCKSAADHEVTVAARVSQTMGCCCDRDSPVSLRGAICVDDLMSRGIGFRSITEGLHTEGAMGKAMLTIMAAFAQLERDTMIERTRAGLAAAAANGRKRGRRRKVDDADAAKARSMREKGINASDIAKMLGVSRATVYRYLAGGEPFIHAKR
jgi:predicted transcriptional regulator YheO